MTIIETLKNYKYIKNLIDADLAEVKDLREMAESIRAIDYSRDRVQTSEKGSSSTDLINKALDLERRALQEMEQLQGQLQSIHESMEKLQPLHKVTLQYIYIDGRSIEDTADALGYSVRQMHRIKRQALAAIAQCHCLS